MRIDRRIQVALLLAVLASLSACGSRAVPSAKVEGDGARFSYDSVPGTSAADTNWRGYFGSDPSEPSVGYTLLGAGFLQADTEDSIESHIKRWLRSHPKARLVLVTDYGGEPSPDGSKMYWAWLVDGSSNLNVELVRAGECQKEVMSLPDGARLLVGADAYKAFADDVASAEKSARQDKLGMWK